MFRPVSARDFVSPSRSLIGIIHAYFPMLSLTASDHYPLQGNRAPTRQSGVGTFEPVRRYNEIEQKDLPYG